MNAPHPTATPMIQSNKEQKPMPINVHKKRQDSTPKHVKRSLGRMVCCVISCISSVKIIKLEGGFKRNIYSFCGDWPYSQEVYLLI